MIFRNLTRYKSLISFFLIASLASILTGCARPNDEDMEIMLSDAYNCKWIKVDDYKKTDSLPGLWSYVAQYEFNLTFRDGQAGAQKFIKGLYNTVPSETDWQKVLQNPNARAYIRDNCTPPAQKILEQVVFHSYTQLADKKNAAVKIPLSIPLSGWAETTSGRGGWAMDMRRDKVRDIKVWTEPIKRSDLTAKMMTKEKAQK